MKKIFVFLLFMGWVGSLWAADPPKIMTKGLTKQLSPGSFTTFFLEVEKGENQSHRAELVLPKGWYLITSKKTEKTSHWSYMYTVSMDRHLPAQSYPFSFRVLVDSVLVAETNWSISLEEIRKVEVTPLEVATYFKEGQTAKTSFLVENFGNVTEYFRVTTPFGRILTGDTLQLLPNQTSQVDIEQAIPVSTASQWSQSVEVKLESLNPSGPSLYRVVSVPVYSFKPKKADPFHRFPIEAGMTYLFFEFQGKPIHAYQYVASGEGSIDVAGQHVVGFQIRGPNNLNFPALGSYDEYSFTYKNREKTKVWVGDYFNRVNNLMEFGRFGRGARLERSFSSGQFSLFYQQARLFPDQRGSFGGSVHYQPSDRWRVGIDLANKELVRRDGIAWTTLIGVSGQFVGKNTQANTEVSLGQFRGNWDVGAYHRWISRLGRWYINSETIWTGKNYQGFYTNSRLFVNSVSYHFSQQLAVGVTSNFTRLNPSLDLSVFNTSPLNKTLTSFVSWHLSPQQMFFLNYTFLEREDRIQPSSFHYRENFANLNYSFQNTGWHVQGQLRSGQAINLRAQVDATPKESYAFLAQPVRKFFPWLWVGAYLEYQHTSKFSSLNEPENLFFYGGSLRGDWGKKVSYQWMYRNNYTPDAFFERRSFSDLNIHYKAGAHRFTLTAGRAFLGNGGGDSPLGTRYFSFRYTFTLNTPLRRKRNVGHVTGKLITTDEQISKEGVLVRMGAYQTMTDEQGQFYFSNLPIDRYLMTFDRTSALSGFIPQQRGPLLVEVAPQQTEEVEVKWLNTGGVTGKLTLMAESSSTIPTAFLIKIFNEEESFLTRVEANGTYSFKELKPGRWTIRLLLPENGEPLEATETEQTLQVEGGKIVHHDFSLRQMKRRIFFQGKDFQLIARP